MSGARLGRYALYQLRDYLMGKVIGFLVLSLMLGWITAGILAGTRGPLWKTTPDAARGAFGAVASQASLLLWVGLILSAAAIVANDRTTGGFRFMFAKPVGIARYYGQLWLLHGAAFVTSVGLLIALWSVTVIPISAWPFMAWAALLWVLWGSVIFFFSTIVNLDWLCAALLLIVASFVQGQLDHDGFWYTVLTPILPPVAHYDAVQAALLRRTEIPMGDLAWVVGYGALFLVAGLLVLRRRPMGA